MNVLLSKYSNMITVVSCHTLKAMTRDKINYINYVSEYGIILFYLKESGEEQALFCTSSQKPKLNETTTKNDFLRKHYI